MSVTLAVRAALFALWRDDDDVGDLVANRIYDRVPKRPTFPYVQFGAVQVLDADLGGDCPRSHVYQDVHVYSRTDGRTVEAHRIDNALRAAVRAAVIGGGGLPNQSDGTIQNLRHRDTRDAGAVGELTTHLVVTFEAMVDPAGG